MTEGNEEDKAPVRVYELAFLVSPTISEEKVAEQATRIRAIVEKKGAYILSEEFPKFRQLSYVLTKPLGGKNEKYSSAYFGWVKFESGSDTLADIKTDVEHEGGIVRFLIVKTDREAKFPAKPAFWRKDAPKRETQKPEGKTTPTMTEAEIDKTIEELVVE